MSTTINHEQFVIDGDYLTSVQKLEIVAAAVPAFTILGKKTNDGALSAADAVADGAGANTGTGTVVLDETTPVLAGAKIGDYTLKCISAATAEPAADAVFEVYDPEGAYIGKTDAAPQVTHSPSTSSLSSPTKLPLVRKWHLLLVMDSSSLSRRPPHPANSPLGTQPQPTEAKFPTESSQPKLPSTWQPSMSPFTSAEGSTPTRLLSPLVSMLTLRSMR